MSYREGVWVLIHNTYVIFFFSIANIFNELWAVISLNLKQIKLNDDTVEFYIN